jgi:hypothetical protein
MGIPDVKGQMPNQIQMTNVKSQLPMAVGPNLTSAKLSASRIGLKSEYRNPKQI